jgi:hypothetical protein
MAQLYARMCARLGADDSAEIEAPHQQREEETKSQRPEDKVDSKKKKIKKKRHHEPTKVDGKQENNKRHRVPSVVSPPPNDDRFARMFNNMGGGGTEVLHQNHSPKAQSSSTSTFVAPTQRQPLLTPSSSSGSSPQVPLPPKRMVLQDDGHGQDGRTLCVYPVSEIEFEKYAQAEPRIVHFIAEDGPRQSVYVAAQDSPPSLVLAYVEAEPSMKHNGLDVLAFDDTPVDLSRGTCHYIFHHLVRVARQACYEENRQVPLSMNSTSLWSLMDRTLPGDLSLPPPPTSVQEREDVKSTTPFDAHRQQADSPMGWKKFWPMLINNVTGDKDYGWVQRLPENGHLVRYFHLCLYPHLCQLASSVTMARFAVETLQLFEERAASGDIDQLYLPDPPPSAEVELSKDLCDGQRGNAFEHRWKKETVDRASRVATQAQSDGRKGRGEGHAARPLVGSDHSDDDDEGGVMHQSRPAEAQSAEAKSPSEFCEPKEMSTITVETPPMRPCMWRVFPDRPPTLSLLDTARLHKRHPRPGQDAPVLTKRTSSIAAFTQHIQPFYWHCLLFHATVGLVYGAAAPQIFVDRRTQKPSLDVPDYLLKGAELSQALRDLNSLEGPKTSQWGQPECRTTNQLVRKDHEAHLEFLLRRGVFRLRCLSDLPATVGLAVHPRKHYVLEDCGNAWEAMYVLRILRYFKSQPIKPEALAFLGTTERLHTEETADDYQRRKQVFFDQVDPQLDRAEGYKASNEDEVKVEDQNQLGYTEGAGCGDDDAWDKTELTQDGLTQPLAFDVGGGGKTGPRRTLTATSVCFYPEVAEKLWLTRGQTNHIHAFCDEQCVCHARSLKNRVVGVTGSGGCGKSSLALSATYYMCIPWKETGLQPPFMDNSQVVRERYVLKPTALLLVSTHVASRNTGRQKRITAHTLANILTRAKYNPAGLLFYCSDVKQLIADELSLVSINDYYLFMCVALWLFEFGSLEIVWFMGDPNQQKCIQGNSCLQEIRRIKDICWSNLVKNHRSNNSLSLNKFVQLFGFYSATKQRHDHAMAMRGGVYEPMPPKKRLSYHVQLDRLARKVTGYESNDDDDDEVEKANSGGDGVANKLKKKKKKKKKKLSPDNVTFIYVGPGEFDQKINQVLEHYKQNPLDSQAILAWTNKFGNDVNLRALQHLNDPKANARTIRTGPFFVGQRVRIISPVIHQNITVAHNQEICVVEAVTPSGQPGKPYTLRLRMPGAEGTSVDLPLTTKLRKSLVTKFALTIYSTQGTEYNTVFHFWLNEGNSPFLCAMGRTAKRYIGFYGHIPHRVGGLGEDTQVCTTSADRHGLLVGALIKSMEKTDGWNLSSLGLAIDTLQKSNELRPTSSSLGIAPATVNRK